MEFKPQLHPEDSDLRTLIDGFAKFVAKNGLEFENLAKEKHKENPQFNFLFGGLYYQYYQQKLNEARLSQNSDLDTSLNQIPPQQSHDPLLIEFEQIIKPVITQCTKDSISAGKSWILSHFQTQDECIRVSQLLLSKTKSVLGMSFFDRLHIVYLINDVLHHCIRKNNQHLRRALQQQIPHIFSNCSTDATQENLRKLTKLVKIWRSQNYFEEGVLVSLDFIVSQRESELAKLLPATSDIELPPPPPPPLQHQQCLPSNPFPPSQPSDSAHIPLQHAPMHPHSFPSSTALSYPHAEAPERPPPPQQGFGNPNANQFSYFCQQPRILRPLPMHPGFDIRRPSYPMEGRQSWPHRPPYPFNPNDQFNPRIPLRHPGHPDRFEHPNRFERPPHPGDGRFTEHNIDSGNYPYMLQEGEQLCPRSPDSHHYPPLPLHKPDIPGRFQRSFQSDSPPHFEQKLEESAPDSVDNFHAHIPYYDLPAGLMAPLVSLEEHDYTPIDPSLIRLPPPQQPSQRLLSAVDSFYSPPTEDTPRNNKGWEAKALIKFFEAKRMARMGRGPAESAGFQRFAPSYEKEKLHYEFSYSSASSPSGSRSNTPPSVSQESSDSSGSPPSIRSPLRNRQAVDTTDDAYPTLNRPPERQRRGGELGFSSYSFHQESAQIEDSELIDDKYAGVGMDLKPSDIYEQYRRTKSYTYNRRPPPTKRGGNKGRK